MKENEQMTDGSRNLPGWRIFQKKAYGTRGSGMKCVEGEKKKLPAQINASSKAIC